jgi:hypothetical protein
MPRRAIVIAAAVASLFARVPAAQAEPVLDLSGTCSGDRIQLRLIIEDPGGAPEMVGYDIYRSALGSCDQAVRITEIPIPRNASGVIDELIADEQRVPNIMYGYSARPVDATRQPLDAWDIFPGFSAAGQLAYVSCGLAPVYHGTVLGVGWAATVEQPCEASCLTPPAYYIEQWPPQYDGYLDGSQSVIVFGAVSCEPGYFEGCLVYAEEVVPASCTVQAPATTWGALKGNYR